MKPNERGAARMIVGLKVEWTEIERLYERAGLAPAVPAVASRVHVPVICEGQLDLIACYRAGVRNVVAPQGTALTAEHTRILKRYVDEVVLCFDSDPAGCNAAIRALDDLLASGLAVRVAAVPAPHDPDSYIKEAGAEAFGRLIGQAEGFFDFYLRHLCASNDLSHDKGRLAVVRLMGQALLKTGSTVLTDTYAQKTAQRLGVSPEAVRAEFRKLQSPKRAETHQIREGGAAESLARPTTLEFWLLKLLLIDDELLDWAAGHLDPGWVAHPLVRQVVSARLGITVPGQRPGLTTLLADLEAQPAARNLLTEAVSEQREIPNRRQQLTDVVKRLRDQSLDRQLADISRQISGSDLPDADRIRLLQRQQDLRQLKRQPFAV